MSNLDTDSDIYSDIDSDIDNLYEPEEVSLTKFNFVVCELYNIPDCGIYYLTHYRFKKYDYDEADYITQDILINSRIEIAQCIYLPSQYCISILKTFWLRLIQRKWKNIINERKKILRKRCNLSSLKYIEINGKWPNDCLNYPLLKGMLSNLF